MPLRTILAVAAMQHSEIITLSTVYFRSITIPLASGWHGGLHWPLLAVPLSPEGSDPSESEGHLCAESAVSDGYCCVFCLFGLRAVKFSDFFTKFHHDTVSPPPRAPSFPSPIDRFSDVNVPTPSIGHSTALSRVLEGSLR